MQRRLTWEGGQEAGVWTRLLGAFRGVFGLQILMEGKKFSVPPVDEIFTSSFSLHLNHKSLVGGGGDTTLTIYLSQFYEFTVLFHLHSSQ